MDLYGEWKRKSIYCIATCISFVFYIYIPEFEPVITDMLYGSCRLSKNLGILEFIKFPSTVEVETNFVVFEQMKGHETFLYYV